MNMRPVSHDPKLDLKAMRAQMRAARDDRKSMWLVLVGTIVLLMTVFLIVG